MITKPLRPAIGIALTLAAIALPMVAAQAKRPADAGAINTAMIASDPMSPVNPFNSGADPLTMPGDARIGVFSYSRDQIFRVLTAPLKLTTIELEPGEKLIADPAMGDSIQWEIDDDKMNHVFIKPHKPDLVNTLHLTTNRREYDFTLIASPAGGLFYQTVRFQYPRAPMTRAAARDDSVGAGAVGGERATDSGNISVSPDKLNWDYSVDGSAEFKPEVVFDDGHSIWMRMPIKAQTWPVPMYKDHGDRVVGNFIRRGDFLVFQRLADEIVLVSGKDEVTVTRGRRRVFGVF
ncbi:TrbG/VirB9 family P-type conjugative transfer protein [Paraburkholderia sp. Tr-20389]|uniref:TrbG/VirB9 family P-type conjugative transfer protein n=1 Tax=Paraburkholderia sp. Tr-20389 TaxID=2703903 RepID=UPI001980A5AA|nr:TrbG/VirB9 family P-type conjugative transfer protein [Paraburkholderia sp. Tr-20389]MBN3754316.1 TrbG/VirB9 family P-type conjugative transfer protein [Paraburkholderia sp. Tr-20389]